MQYKNTKVKVRSQNGDRFLWHCCRCAQGDTLAPYLFIICLDYMLWMSADLMKENSFMLAMARTRRYPTQMIMGAAYDDIMLLANTHTQAQALLHSLKQAAGGIGLHVNADKTELICFNQRDNISILITETCGQVHLFQKQHLIYQNWYQHKTSEGLDSYW